MSKAFLTTVAAGVVSGLVVTMIARRMSNPSNSQQQDKRAYWA